MTSQPFPGARLKARREQAGLSRREVVKHIHVPAGFLEAIESGLVDRLPSRAYTVGFLRTYCRFLGLHPGPYVEAYDASMERPKGFFSLTVATSPPGRPSWLGSAIAWVTITAILLLGWATYSVVVKPEAEIGAGQVQADSLDLRLPITSASD